MSRLENAALLSTGVKANVETPHDSMSTPATGAWLFERMEYVTDRQSWAWTVIKGRCRHCNAVAEIQQHLTPSGPCIWVPSSSSSEIPSAKDHSLST